MDASENSAGKYTVEKDFVKSMATYLNVDRSSSRAALVIFNETSFVVVKFTDYNTKSEFIDAVDEAPFLGGERRIDTALETAATLYPESRFSVSRVAFLVTVGKATTGQDAKPLSEAIQNLRSLGVRMYVTIIGTEADLVGYQAAVENPKDLFVLPSIGSKGSGTVNRVGDHVTQGQ